jgi:hypothetical protein
MPRNRPGQRWLRVYGGMASLLRRLYELHLQHPHLSLRFEGATSARRMRSACARSALATLEVNYGGRYPNAPNGAASELVPRPCCRPKSRLP